MDNKRMRVVLMIVGSVIMLGILGAIIWSMLQRGETPAPTVNTQPTNVAIVNATVNTTPKTPTNTDTELDETVAVIRFANFFAERYGSYSSDANFQNLIDLKPYMTTALQQEVDGFIKQQRNLNRASDYMSVVSRVVSTTVEGVGPKNAIVKMVTQRTEDGDTANAFTQEIRLRLVKEGDEWLTSTADWLTTDGTETPVATNVNSSGNANGNVNLEDLLQQ